MSDEIRQPVLGDHVAVRRKLVPPFMHKLGAKFSQYSWTQQLVPEALWIGLVIDHCGYAVAQQVCGALGQAARAATGGSERPMFAKFSAFTDLSSDAKLSVLNALNRSTLAAIRRSLAPLTSVLPEHPLAFLGNLEPSTEQTLRFPQLLGEFYDRMGRIPVLSIAIAYGMGLEQGMILVAPHLVDDHVRRFEVIDRYPETEESRRAAGPFRASASMLFMPAGPDGAGFGRPATWVEVFWDGIAGFGPCLLKDTLEDEAADGDDPFELFIAGYRNAIRVDLRARLANWPLDLNAVDAFEVVTALLCRQSTLVIEMAYSPGIWTPHIAPIILRAIADVFISFAWILQDPSARAKRFIEDGQGAIKLQIAHQKRAMEASADPDEIAELAKMIEIWSDWLAAQRMEAFVEVNLGSWSGLSTRKMAEDAGFIDFYNDVYQPFSGVAHSNWAHVSMFNTMYCQNPSHRLHRGAAIAPMPLDMHWLYLSNKYLSKTFALFDEKFGLSLPQSAFELIVAEMKSEPREV